MLAEKYKQLIMAPCLALFTTAAWPASGWTSYGAVAELRPTTAGRFLVRLDISSNPSGCRNKHWFYRDYSGGLGVDHMFHTLLTAMKNGQKVRVFVTGGCDLHGYSDISSLSVVP